MARPVMFDPTAFPLTGSRARIEHPGARPEGSEAIKLGVVRLRDGSSAGHITLESAKNVLVVRELCIESAFRSYGLGSECGALLRDFAERGPWTTLRAWAAPELGLSAYFWTRMGLHPLHGAGPEGGIWFERTVG